MNDIEIVPKPLKFNGPLNLTVDEAALEEGSPLMLNCYADSQGGNNRRPGLSPFKSISSGAIGTGRRSYYWHQQKIHIVIIGSRIYALTDPTADYIDITGDPLEGNLKPCIVATDNLLYIAAGGHMLWWNGTGKTTAETSTYAPYPVSTMAALDGVIQANVMGTQQWQYSNSGDTPTSPFKWLSLSLPLSANGGAGNITAMVTGYRELYMGTPVGLEMWEDLGGDPPYSRTLYIERGVSAPATMMWIGSGLFWLDNYRRFMILTTGSSPQSISDNINPVIQAFSTVEDAFSMLIIAKGKAFYVTTFPSANRTFALDLESKLWSEWTYWNKTTRESEAFLAEDASYCQEWGGTVAIGRNEPESVKVFMTSGLQDDGSEIQWKYRTAHRTHGSINHKFCPEMIFQIARGRVATPGTDTPQMLLRWRNDGKPFGIFHTIDLGQIGDTEFHIRLHRLGRYRSRQYEIQITDPVDVVIRGATEYILETQ